ncbi:MAG: alpha/beta hydrolase [Deltaproteobacteria bacterium]|nr:alpha/beta hydrolase [Deltaproteobacteria bacterium]
MRCRRWRHAGRVDSGTQAANEAIEKLLASLPSIDTREPADVRAERASGRSPYGELVKLERAEVRCIPGPAGEIPLRILRPAGEVRGVYLHFHGGGWTLGAEDQQDPMLDAFAQRAGVVAVSVGYRLAPEHPYPSGPDDCEAAALWVMEHARELGSEQLVIGGESAGAHLSAVTLLRLRDKHGATPFRAANLAYGAYDLGFTPGVRNWGKRNLVLSTPIIEWFTNHFVPERGQRRHPDVSPLYASLTGMPPALFTVGTLDPLLDDSLFMASRWEAAGSPAELAIYPGGIHAFNMLPLPLAEQANERCRQFVTAALEAEG